MTICESNIPNGSSQMAEVPSVILTSHALRNYSKISHERDPTNLSPLLIASSNKLQIEFGSGKIAAQVQPTFYEKEVPLYFRLF